MESGSTLPTKNTIDRDSFATISKKQAPPALNRKVSFFSNLYETESKQARKTLVPKIRQSSTSKQTRASIRAGTKKERLSDVDSDEFASSNSPQERLNKKK